MEMLKELRRRSLMERTTWRLSFRLRDSRTSSRTRNEPTIMPFPPRGRFRGNGRASEGRGIRRALPAGSQRPLHLLDAVALDHVVHLDVVVTADLEAAVEPGPDLLGVLL